VKSLFSYCVALLLLLISNMSAAVPTCQKTGEVCVDGPSTKYISGANIYRNCWNYMATYNCVDPNAVDYCQPVKDLGCGVTNSGCNQVAFNGTCLNYKNTYLCTDGKEVATPLPTNVWLMATTYRITKDDIDDSACAAMAASGTCAKQGADVCIDATPTKNINGLDVTRSCWAWERTYNCSSSNMISDCQEFSSNPKCTETGSKCVETMDQGKGPVCQVVEHTYKCTTGGSGPTTVAECDTQQFCIQGNCFNTGYLADKDFGKAVSGMEIARQAGFYLDPYTSTFFNGSSGKCDKKLFGLANCCKTSGGGGSMNNSSMAVGAKAVDFGYEYVRAIGSPYAYDMMFNSSMPWLVDRSVDAWSSNAWSYTGDVSLYGFTFEVGVNGIAFTGFDPYSFAISVAIQIVMSMLECSQDEQLLGMKRGQNLCVYVGDYCSSKILNACVTRTEGYCCYNSRLAKIIAQGGRAQLGKSFGSGENPDCTGFTPEQLQAIDFSKIDMSEFIAEIAPSVKSATPAMQRAQNKIQSYYGP